MRIHPSDVAFTDTVKSHQTAKGSREIYAHMEETGGWKTAVTPDLRHFLSGLDMFYLATSNGEGWPYIQYRGGAPGFLKVLDEQTLGFADFRGNQQYISTGNLSENPQAFLFLMDYDRRRRVKIWGTARVVEDDAELLTKLSDPEYPGAVERAIVFTIEAWDANCPQHIHRRVPEAQVRSAEADARETIERLQAKVADLEAQLARAKRPD